MADLSLTRMAAVTGAVLVATVLSGCAAGSVVAGVATTSTTAASTPSPSPEAVSALSFDLPAGVGYQQVATRIGEDGAVVRRWRLKLDGKQRFCVVVAGEQRNFPGSFPASSIAAFRAGRDPGGRIIFNAKVSPIPGTTAGVRQESSYVFSLGSLGTETGVLLVRQFLTADLTLISLDVAGPEADAVHCQLSSIVDSLRVATAADRSSLTASTAPTPPATSEGEESPS
jgi:hypothetical protein